MNQVLFKGVVITVMFAPTVFEERNNEPPFHLLIPHLPNHPKGTLSEYFWLHLSWSKQNWKMAIYHSKYSSIYCNICSISHS